MLENIDRKRVTIQKTYLLPKNLKRPNCYKRET
jgi:hypothetical protein